MGQPKVSTRLNKIVIEKLVEEVTRIKTAKQQRDVELIKVQLDAAKVNFLKSQNVLAIFGLHKNRTRLEVVFRLLVVSSIISRATSPGLPICRETAIQEQMFFWQNIKI